MQRIILNMTGEGNNCIFRVLKISTQNGNLISESGFGAKGYWYMFPCVIPIKNGDRFSDTLLVGFARSSNTIYPEARVFYMMEFRNGENHI